MHRSLAYVFLILLVAVLIRLLPMRDPPEHQGIAKVEPVDVLSTNARVIPFVLTSSNSIAIDAVLNGTDSVTLMLHTAVNDVSITRDGTAKAPSLKFNQTANVTSWGGARSARVSSGNSLQIGNQTWTDLSITEDEKSGHLTDGKFGLNLFADRIVRIDFERCELTIYDTLPVLDPGFQRIEIRPENGTLMIPATVVLADQAIAHHFLMHSGFGGTALLDDEFVWTHSLDSQLPTISQSELKDALGNVLKTKQVRLPGLVLADATFKELPIGIFEGALGKQRMSVIGGELLRRFHIVLDARRDRLYLKPNSMFSSEIKPG